MTFYPVIMCGGSGVRLWPESRPDRPKQFLPLIESRSLFQMTAARMSPSDPWERLLVAGLARDFQQMRLDFLTRSKGGAPAAFVAQWLDANAASVRQFRSLIARAQAAPVVAPAMLAQAASQARTLLGR